MNGNANGVPSAPFVVSALTIAALLGPLRAQVPAGGPVDPVVTAAETAITAGDAEGALLQLWRALADPLPPRTPATIAKMNELIARIDPLAGDRTAAFGGAARTLLAMARAYRSRKWSTSALSIATIAAGFDAEAARIELAAAGGTRPAAAPPRDPIAALGRGEVSGDWTDDGEVLHSPKELSPGSAVYLTTTQHEDHRIAMTVDHGRRNAMFGVLVGAKDFGNYYIVDTESVPAEKLIKVSAYRWADGNLTVLGNGKMQRRPPLGEQVVLEVLVRGAVLDCRVDGISALRVECPGPVRGAIGCYVSGSSAHRGSLAIRDIVVGPLPDAPDADTDPSRIAAAVDEALQFAAQQLQRKDAEGAAERLRAARTQTLALAGESRVRRLAAIDRQLQTADPLHGRRSKAFGEAAATLRQLADRYAATMPRAAAAIAEQMAQLDPEGQAAAAAEFAARAAAAAPPAAAPETAAPAGDPGADNRLLREWFEHGTQPFSASMREWQFGYDGAMSPALAVGEVCLVADRGPSTGGTAKIQFRLPPGATAGLVFGWQSPLDFARATVTRTDAGVRLVLQRRRGTDWVFLASSAGPAPESVREDWLELTVAYGKKQLLAACAECRVAAAADPNLQGRYGLVAATSATEPMTIQFRRFVPPAPEAAPAPAPAAPDQGPPKAPDPGK